MIYVKLLIYLYILFSDNNAFFYFFVNDLFLLVALKLEKKTECY